MRVEARVLVARKLPNGLVGPQDVVRVEPEALEGVDRYQDAANAGVDLVGGVADLQSLEDGGLVEKRKTG